MYNNDDEKRKQEMLQRVMQNNQQYNTQEQQRKQEMYTRIMNNEPSPTARRTKVVQNSTPITTRLRQKMQQIYIENKDRVPITTTSQNRTSTVSTNQKIDMTNLTPEQKSKLEQIQKETNPYKMQSASQALVNTGKVSKEQADKIVQEEMQKQNSLPYKTKQAMLNAGKNVAGAFGFDKLAKNTAEFAKKLPSVLKEQGKATLETVDELATNAPQIIDSAMRGADTGGSDFLSYAIRLNKKKDETLDRMGTFGKVLAVAKGDTEYLFTKRNKRDIETNRILGNLQGFKNSNTEQLAENQRIVEQNSNTGIAKKLNELAPSIGNNMAGAAIGTVNPVLGTTYFIGSAAGSYYDDGIQRGMNDNQALLYGTIAGTLEGVTEKFAVGKSVKAGMLLGKGNIQKALIETGISLSENFAQEAIMEPLQESAAAITGGKDKANFDGMLKRMFKSGIDGALSAILMEGATSGVSSAQNVQTRIENGENVSVGEIQQAFKDIQESGKVDIEKEIKSSINYEIQKVNEQQTTQRQDSLKGKSFEDIVDEAMSNYQYEEVKSPLQDRDIKTIGKEKVNAYQYDNPEVKPYFQEMAQMLGEDIGNVAGKDNRSTIKGGGTSLNTNIAAVKQLHEMGYSYNQIVDGLTNIIEDNGKENNAISKKLEIIIDDQLRNGYINSYGKFVSPNEEYINLINKHTNNLSLNQQQQISQTENKNGLNQNVETQNETKFSKILNNKELPMQSYNYEKSDNVKIDNLRQQANKYFNNSQEAHNYVDMLEKIIADKNIEINLDTNLGDGINGQYKNGVITINPNSNRAGEFLAIHELTHAIGTDSMIKMVENYRKSNAEFDNEVKKLLSNYNQTELNEEALADIAGQLFGNQEYINNLAKTNPSMFKRIYNEIKYLWHQFTGYKNQDQFVDDLMFKWEQAYRKNNQLNDTNRKSLVGESATLADKDKLKQAQKMESSGMTADEIFKETGWYKGNEGKWRFELDDSNWNIKDIKNYNKEGTFKLEDILDAPELYKAYPELKDFTVHMRSNMEDSNFGALATDIFTGEKSIVLNSNKIRNSDMKSYEMLGLKNQSEIFSVLQHEIQHYIQNKEEFSQGASPGYWFDEKNKEFKNKISNVFGDKAELHKKYGFEKGNNIKFALDSILIQKSIIHNTQIELAELKAKNVKNENNQRMIDLDEHIIKDRNQWIDGDKDKLKSYVSEKEIEKLNKVLAEYDNFLKKRT